MTKVKMYAFAILFVALILIIYFFKGRSTADRSAGKAIVETVAEEPGDGKALFNRYCSTCHMEPDPARLTKTVWDTRVLPVMAILMGLEDENYERGITAEEKAVEEQHHLIPDKPMISQAGFGKIKEYILSLAPDSLSLDRQRLKRNKPLKQFVRHNIKIEGNTPSLITAIQFHPESNILWLGDFNNRVMRWQWRKGVIGSFQASSPVVHFNFYQGNTFVTEIGDLMPSELSKGSFSISGSAGALPLITSLHRPVFSLLHDFNNDKIPEIITCNFGKNMGSLSMFIKNDNQASFLEKILLPIPGATKAYVEDMDRDGRKDIVALMAQGEESIYIFYNKGNMDFVPVRILRFPPDYGTADIQLVDFNDDELLDIITANGDNADYSIILKDYHGIRIHINEGNEKFSEKFFYPLYGVTRLLCEDFDNDGKRDIAATAFYPDQENLKEESFVFLKNKGGFQFTSFTDTTDLPVKSLCIEKADIDEDGDLDIILGNFVFSPVPAPLYLEQQWRSANYSLIIFENKLKTSSR